MQRRLIGKKSAIFNSRPSAIIMQIMRTQETNKMLINTTMSNEIISTFKTRTKKRHQDEVTAHYHPSSSSASTILRCAPALEDGASALIITTLLTIAALTNCCLAAYQFPIQHRPVQQQQQSPSLNSHHLSMSDTMIASSMHQPEIRRIDESGPTELNQAPSSAEEGEQLRQLHQVVDSMAELLNEDEQQQRQEAYYRNERSPTDTIADGQPKQQQQQQQRQSMKVEEALSESAIRQALEDLERMQQQERDQSGLQPMSEAESINQASIVPSPDAYSASQQQQEQQQHQQQQQKAQQASQQSKQSALESLIDELGDELINDEQLEAATQEAERMLRHNPTRQSDAPVAAALAKNHMVEPVKQQKLDQELVSPTDDMDRSPKTVLERASEPAKLTDALKPPSNSITSSSKVSPTSNQQQQQPGKASSLFIGQLDSTAASELGSALADDFYNFHASNPESGSHLNRASLSSLDNVELQSSGSTFLQPNHHQQQQQQQQVGDSLMNNPQNDLEPAAQTRNSIARHEPQSSPFEQEGPLRFDFNQPASIDGPPSQARGIAPQDSNDEALVRAFRQQVGADTSHFPSTSTLMPLGGDNFWRPTSVSGNQVQNGPSPDQLSQQYSRAHNGAGAQNTPHLPESRFQASNGNNQFQQQQQQANSRQPQHIHFTGHSFIHSASNNGPTQFPPAQPVNPRPSGFSSSSPTPASIISVLSGSDTSLGNSVSWNPPATINPPPPHNQQHQQQHHQQAFNQQFPAPPAQLSPPPENTLSFFPPNRAALQPASNPSLFNPPSPFSQAGPIEQPEAAQPSDFRDQRAGTGNNFPTSTELINQPVVESTTAIMRESDRFAAARSTSGAQQWSQPTGVSLAPVPVERDASDSQPRSSVSRSPPNSGNQRFFSPKDLTTTVPSISTTGEYLLPRNQPQARAISTSTLATPITTTVAAAAAANGLSSTTLESASTAGNNTKKEDMVIYYYYYYDDNKNATVVAKNISASAVSTPGSVPLDAAIEADGGIEDTPYMDDPAPMLNLRPITTTTASAPATTSTTTTSTTTTSTTAATPTVSLTQFDQSHSAGRGRVQSASSPQSSRLSHTNTMNDQAGSRSGISTERHSSRDLGELSNLELLERAHNDQQRTGTAGSHLSNTGRASSKPASETGFISSSTPFSVPSTSSISIPSTRSTTTSSSLNRALNQGHHHHQGNLNGGRFQPASTESSLRNSLSTTTTSSHTSNQHQQQHQPPVSIGGRASATSGKMQHDLINNVLNGIPVQLRHHQTGLSSTTSTTLSTPTTSQQGAQSGPGRSPLSNASRYGTNNNLMLDPYGLDPTAPATLTHSSHSSEPAVHKNWPTGSSSPSSSSSSASSHLFGRKPAPTSSFSSDGSNILPAAPARIPSTGSMRQDNQQNFPSQRNSNLPSNTQTSVAKVSTSTANLSPSSRLSGQSVNRQFFPESQLNTGAHPVDHPAVVGRASSQQQSSKPAVQMLSTEQHSMPKQVRPQVVPPTSGELGANRLVASSENSISDDVPREPRVQANNGRPSTPDGNTGNGFTRSPLQAASSFSVTPMPTSSSSSSSSSSTQSQSFSSSTSNLNSHTTQTSPSSTMSTTTAANEQASSAFPATGTQPTISTSVSRVFNIPQAQSTTSISPPTISSTSVSVTQSSSSTSSSPAITTLSSLTGPSSSGTVSSSPAQQMSSGSTPTPESASSITTESSAESASASRRKFGNRNSRFQTRLSATAARSTTSTTSTTPAPSSSSTTRRPTTSTTRKTSKQLFAGRRRLSSVQTPEAQPANGNNGAPNIASGTSNLQANSLQSVSGSAAGNSMPNEFPAASSSSSSSSPAGRARFGNSFTARTRSTTTSPSAAQPYDRSITTSTSTQKPNLFGSQRASTARPRLPFLKPTANKPLSTPNGSEVATGSIETNNSVEANSVTPVNSASPAPLPSVRSNTEDKSSTVPNENGLSDESNEDISTGSLSPTIEDEMNDKKETLPTSTSMNNINNSSSSISVSMSSSISSEPATTPIPTSSSTPPSDSTSARNKPKVRPLFASRQRNTSLFGNRRTGNSSTNNSN